MSNRVACNHIHENLMEWLAGSDFPLYRFVYVPLLPDYDLLPEGAGSPAPSETTHESNSSARLTDESMVPRVGTHWTRWLDHDFFAGNAPALPLHEEKSVETKDSNRDAGPDHRSPLAQALIVFGAYIAMYLAVAGLIHFVPLLYAQPLAASAFAVVHMPPPTARFQEERDA